MVIRTSDSILDQELRKCGVAQNQGKKKHCRSLCRSWVPQAPFLGVIFDATHNWWPEVESRCDAIAKGWHMMRRFWKSKATWTHKKLVFRSNVVGAGVSGLPALVLAPAQIDRVDSKCVRYGRALLGGVAERQTRIDDEGREVTVIRSLSNLQ
eukprot:4498077-Pyramimonas_sp.AAC.1